jgi:hypothetical protein
MGGVKSSNPYGAGDRAVAAIDRKRERERRFMLKTAHKNADELALRLVQRLLDREIIETTSESAIREVFSDLLRGLSEMEDFEIQFKIAPIRQLVVDPNFLSLYLTQYITEDLMNHPKIEDIFGDDVDVYKAVDSVFDSIRPKEM